MIKFLIILTSNHSNAGGFIEHTLNNMEYDENEDWDYEITDEIRTILENPQDVINKFNIFCQERRYRILDILFKKGLSYDLGVMMLSMYDFRTESILEFVNEK